METAAISPVCGLTVAIEFSRLARGMMPKSLLSSSTTHSGTGEAELGANSSEMGVSGLTVSRPSVVMRLSRVRTPSRAAETAARSVTKPSSLWYRSTTSSALRRCSSMARIARRGPAVWLMTEPGARITVAAVSTRVRSTSWTKFAT